MSEEVKYDIGFDESGNLLQKEKKKVKRGKKSKSAGSDFERRVRCDLYDKGWIVDKWTNNVDLEKNEIFAAKRKMKFINKNMRFMALGTGFPDFIAFKRLENDFFKVVGIEVKTNGKLSKIEKEKCRWYLDEGVFSEIWIAMKVKEKGRVRVVYDEFN